MKELGFISSCVTLEPISELYHTASPLIDPHLLECLVAPPDTVTLLIQNFQGGVVTLTRGRTTVPPAAQSTQREPEAWRQQDALKDRTLSRCFTRCNAAGRCAVPVLIGVTGVPNQVIIHIRLQREQNALPFIPGTVCTEPSREGRPGPSSLGLRISFSGMGTAQNCKRTTPYWCRHNAEFSEMPSKTSGDTDGLPTHQMS